MANKDYNKIPRIFKDLSQEIVGKDEAKTTTIDVTPSTTAATYNPQEGYVGFDTVNVSAVDSSIDSNITAENIKKDVEILGVTGSYEGINLEPWKLYQTEKDEHDNVIINKVYDNTLSYGYYSFDGSNLREENFDNYTLYYYNGSSYFETVSLEEGHTYRYDGYGEFSEDSSSLTDHHLYFYHYYSGNYVTKDFGEYNGNHLLMFDAYYGNKMEEVKTSAGNSISLNTSDPEYPFQEVGDSIEISYEGRRYTLTLTEI